MRNHYPLSSLEMNDKILSLYENLISILGYNHNNVSYSGLYDQLDNRISEILSSSGIPHFSPTLFSPGGVDDTMSSSQIAYCLKFDYIYRKHTNAIDPNIKFGDK